MNKTDKMLKGVLATITSVGLAVAMSGCSSNASQGSSNDDSSDDITYTSKNTSNRPPEPTDQQCKDWDWDDDAGTYVCDDDSSYHGHYFYGGHYYPTYTALNTNSGYQSYRKSSSFAGKNNISLEKSNNTTKSNTTSSTTNNTNTTKGTTKSTVSTGQKGFGSGTSGVRGS